MSQILAFNAQCDRPLNLLLIDDDSIFRLGLRVILEQIPHWQVVAEADQFESSRQILASGEPGINLIILEFNLGRFSPQTESGLQFCQQLKNQFPHIPVLLLSAFPKAEDLILARQAGIEGFCPKGTEVSQIVEAICQIAAGQLYWHLTSSSLVASSADQSGFSRFLNRLRLSGLRQIELTMKEVNQELENTLLSQLDRAILSGRQRELLASRWVVNWLLAPRVTTPTSLNQVEPKIGVEESRSLNPQKEDKKGETNSAITVNTWQFELFDRVYTKIKYGVDNLTNIPLEVDIFNTEKKQELLSLILRKLEIILEELRLSSFQSEQLLPKRSSLLQDVWQESITDYFGKYYTLKLRNQDIELVEVLLQDFLIVKSAILDKIPLVVELFDHLLFQVPLDIENGIYEAGTQKAIAQAELVLQNMLIQLANAVVQPLLNHFADVEIIKQKFYDGKLISTREIEKFRNDLSWKYRVEKYIGEPTDIFASRYGLFAFDGQGVRKFFIYAPRGKELEQLQGIPLVVTLALEARDAIAPRLRSTVAFIGKGVVYLLTQVIGRGIGLIGRGILQGIGSSLQDSRFGKNGKKGDW